MRRLSLALFMTSADTLYKVFSASLNDHLEAVGKLSSSLELLEEVAARMEASLRKGGKVLWFGNGGSAADAQHLAAELVGRYRRERRGLASIALTTDTSVLTAIGNDYGFECIFSRQLEALCGPDDVVVGISTSRQQPECVRGAGQGAGAGRVHVRDDGRRGRAGEPAGRRLPAGRGAGCGAGAGGPHPGRTYAVRSDRRGLLRGCAEGWEADARQSANAGAAGVSAEDFSRQDSGSHEVVRLLERDWDGRHIVVVGDVMLDKYIQGSVERISPEAPVPVVHASQRGQQPGGAGNVAMNLTGLGARASVVGFGGGDEDQVALAEAFKAAGVSARLIAVEGMPTTSKLRILGGTQQIVRLDVETGAERPAEAYVALLAAALELLEGADGLILSDYAKGTLTGSVCRRLIDAAKARGVPVLVDPKGRDFERYRGATTISPNLKELALATGDPHAPMEAVLEGGQAMAAELGLEYVTVTLGERGIAVLRPEGRFLAPAIARKVFDVSGAGDTVIAMLALAAASGIGIEDAVKAANVAAGIVVGKLGTVPVARHELVAALTEFPGTASQEKALDLSQLLVRVAEWRAAGHTVVFTNGCFDLLHVGHIALLEACRRFGDKVVVGINSDASVAGLKGPARPVVKQRERARMLAALAATDAVVVFDELTPIELVLAVRPDVLVKGGDYTEESVVGGAGGEELGRPRGDRADGGGVQHDPSSASCIERVAIRVRGSAEQRLGGEKMVRRAMV